MKKSVEARESWLRQFVQLVRARLQAGGKLPFPNNFKQIFSFPAQIIALTTEYPNQSRLYVIHLQSLPDLSIWAYGPLRLYELMPQLEEIAVDPIFEEMDSERPFFRQEPLAKQTVGSFLGTEFTMFLEEIQDQIFNPPSGQGYGFAHYGKVQIIRFQGDYLLQSPDRYLEDWISQYDEFQNSFQTGPQSYWTKEDILKQIEAQRQTRKWLGAFLFPPVRIGDIQPRTVRDQMFRSISAFDLGKVVLIDSLGARKFMATYFGYVGLLESDRKIAAENLNVLSCVLLLLGTPQFVIIPRELGDFDLDEEVRSFRSSGVPGTERSVGNKDFALNKFNPPNMISIAFLRSALTISGKVLKNADLIQYMMLLLDSYSRLSASEFDQAFYSAWILIEAFLNRLWESTLQEKQVSGKRLDALQQSNEWTLNNKIETMSLLNVLSKEEYETYNSLRRRRNEILHPRTRATEEDAEKCYNVAKSLVQKLAAPLMK